MDARFSAVTTVVGRAVESRVLRVFWVLVVLLAAGTVACALPVMPEAPAPSVSMNARTPVPDVTGQHSLPLLPYLEWLPDETGALSIEDMTKADVNARFQPMPAQLPFKASGPCWLRLSLAPRNAGQTSGERWLDLGQGIPGNVLLYLARHNAQGQADVVEWQRVLPVQTAFFPLSAVPEGPLTAYLKLDSLPGLWFAPVLRSSQNAATDRERLEYPAILIVLGVVLLLCLLRALTERGQWRLWTVLYVALALFQAFWGVPVVTGGQFSMRMLPGVLAPGIALMLLPHVARHLMETPRRSTIIDIQYLVLTLPGIVVALLPLFPPFTWLCRYLNLWPLGSLLLVPTTVGAWLMGLPGSRRFLLACLAPGLTTLISILTGLGVEMSLPLEPRGTAPLWGVALGALLIAGTASARGEGRADEDARLVLPNNEGVSAASALPDALSLSPTSAVSGTEMPALRVEMPASAILSPASASGEDGSLVDTGAPLLPEQAAENAKNSALAGRGGLLPELGGDATGSDAAMTAPATGLMLHLSEEDAACGRSSGLSGLEEKGIAAAPQPDSQHSVSGQSISSDAGSLSLDIPADDVVTALPPLASLLLTLDQDMEKARSAFQQQEFAVLEAAAGHLAARTEGCGLRVLARIARCVEGAARARDKDALTHLLPELESAVARNRVVLRSGN